VQAAVAEREALGVQINATQAEAVRFHDDKTTYTGMHARGGQHGDDRSGATSRSERLRSEGVLDHSEQEELPWEPTAEAFLVFCKGDTLLNGREFVQLCDDCGLYNSKFVSADADVTFNKVKNRGERTIDFQQFKDACIAIASKRGSTVADVQRKVEAGKPRMKGVTEAEHVRFHDDKSTYTGAHAHNEKISGADPNAALGRHEKIAAAGEAALHAHDEEEDSWTEVERVFNAFAGASADLDGKEFHDMCLHINGLQRGGFQKGDIDVVFTSCCAKGARRIQFEQFQNCVRKIALKKDEAVHVTQACIGRSKGPTLHGATKAEYNRFHDDKNSYTGAQAVKAGI